MPRIKTDELLERIRNGKFQSIHLKGLQNGSFYILLQCADGSFIHENDDGSMKEYPKADHALLWLRRMTKAKMVIIDIEIWRNDL